MGVVNHNRLRLIWTGGYLLFGGALNVWRDYSNRTVSQQSSLDWAAHPFGAALGAFLPVVVLAPIVFWYLGRARWFKQISAHGGMKEGSVNSSQDRDAEPDQPGEQPTLGVLDSQLQGSGRKFGKVATIAVTAVIALIIGFVSNWIIRPDPSSAVRTIASWADNGTDLYNQCGSSDAPVSHACGEYLLGVLDAVVATRPANAQLVCPPPSISYMELEAAFLSWAKANPSLLVLPRIKAAANALMAAYPCGR